MRRCEKSKLSWIYLLNLLPSLKSTSAQASVSTSKQGTPKVSFLTALIAFQIDYLTGYDSPGNVSTESLEALSQDEHNTSDHQAGVVPFTRGKKETPKESYRIWQFLTSSQWLNTNYSTLLNPQYLYRAKGKVKLGNHCNTMKRPVQPKGQCSKKASTAEKKGQCREEANAVKRPAQRAAQREGQHSKKVLLGSGGGPGDANPPKMAPQAKAEGFGGDAMPPKGSGVSPAIMAGATKKPSLP